MAGRVATRSVRPAIFTTRSALDGWTTVTVRYPFTPQVTVEHQVDTIKAAIRWARTELPGLPGHGLSPTHLVVAGGSAGGHLAAMAALTADGDDEQVDACIGIYGVYDMANRNRTRAHWTKTKREVMLASVDEAPERYRAVSPLDQIHAASPPMLIVHGTHDTLVPMGEGEQFVEALRDAGRPVDFVPVYGAQHAFDVLSSITQPHGRSRDPSWLRRTVLEAHGPVVRSRTDGVIAAVDVDDLAGRRREPVAQQCHARPCHRLGIVDVPAERSAPVPRVLEQLEARDRLGGHRLDRTGGHEVAADLTGAEFAAMYRDKLWSADLATPIQL